MADLGNLLLEAAGRIEGSNKSRYAGRTEGSSQSRYAGRTEGSSQNRYFAPPSRTRCENAYSDDGTDSKVEDWDENPVYGGRKSNWPQQQLKKRGKDRDDQGRWGEKEAAKGFSRGGGGGDDFAVCISARSADRADHKADVLTELHRKRMKQQGIDSSRSGSGSSQGYSSLKRKTSLPSAGVSSSSQSDSQSENGNIPTYEDIKGITMRRSQLVKWFMEPFFDDLIAGCFVRIGIGMKSGQSIYRLCIVRNVDAKDPDKQYMLENKMTSKYLNCVWGSETSAARWQMTRISDSPPLEEEYNQWKREVERTSGGMPTKHEVARKKEDIKMTNSFVYSAEIVRQMVEEKKSAATRPWNIAAEKERLRREMEEAQYRNDEFEVEKIKAKLEELAVLRQAQESKNSKDYRVAEMNKKNRVANFLNTSELKPKNTDLKSGEGGSDPYSRRWPKLTNCYAAGVKNDDASEIAERNKGVKINANDDDALITARNKGVKNKANNDTSEIAKRNKGVKIGVAAIDDTFEASLDAGKLVDQETDLHNFDLPISLSNLQKFGGPEGVLAASLARRQKIEATIGVQVPENDGRRHTKVISVSEYKRRKGIK